MKRVWTIIIAVCITMNVMAQKEKFCIAREGKTAVMVVDEQDWSGVIRAVKDLRDDVQKVAGAVPDVVQGKKAIKGSIVVGTIGKSRIIDKMVKQKKLDVRI